MKRTTQAELLNAARLHRVQVLVIPTPGRARTYILTDAQGLEIATATGTTAAAQALRAYVRGLEGEGNHQ